VKPAAAAGAIPAVTGISAARRFGMAAARLAAIVVLVTALAACGSSGRVAQGIVTDITSNGPVKVERFTIRTTDGTALTFRVGTLELDGNAFPAEHLGEHRLTAQPVAVAYREEGGELVAYRLVDAPWVK
jgi:hypothetical protein